MSKDKQLILVLVGILTVLIVVNVVIVVNNVRILNVLKEMTEPIPTMKLCVQNGFPIECPASNVK